MRPRAFSSRLTALRPFAPHLTVATLALALVGCEPAEEEPEETMAQEEATAVGDQEDPCREFQDLTPTPGPVDITVDPQGIPVVTPAVVRMSKEAGGTMDWTSGDYPWLVIFQPNQNNVLPMQAETLGGAAAQAAGSMLNPDAPCGNYKYSVVVWDQANEQLLGVDPPFQIIP